MAVMISGAVDWSFDMFMEDVKQYKGTPMKGVYCIAKNERQQFMVWLKNLVRDFKAEWSQVHEHEYDRYDGYIGDCFKRVLVEACFSDYYKDVYGQRPHLDRWFYIHALGLPMQSDVGRMFCSHPIENAIEDAKRCRDEFESAFM